MAVAVAGWVWVLPLAAMALLCPLMMLSMFAMMIPGVRRIFGNRGGGHVGHGMMMCHGMSHEDAHEQAETPAASGNLLDELRAQREALDTLIARAESETGETAGTPN